MEDKIIFTLEIENLGATILQGIFGEQDENIKYLATRYNMSINAFGDSIILRGEAMDKLELVRKIIYRVADTIERNESVKSKDMRLISDAVEEGQDDELVGLSTVIAINSRGKQIKPKTLGQVKYVQSIMHNTVVFGVGPAGTGKTYLAVALAVKAFKNREIERIILTRPAVEAGEKLGFLPGDLGAKVDPYLRPLVDALQEMFGVETYAKLLEKGVIEIAPLAYMRGRTLPNAFIILDEAQNTTREQMKMFLTRMGEGSRIVVTGDVTQIDLPRTSMSGLLHVMKILTNVEGLDIIKLTGKDVVRHEMVMRIVNAYEDYEKKESVDEEKTRD